MKIKNIKIRTQLIIGFTIIILFVITLGSVSFIQNNQLYQQTETLYQHPFQVRRALDALNNDILNMRLGMRDLMLAVNDQEDQAALQIIELHSNYAEKEFSTIKEFYLGPPEDVEEAYQAYIEWKVAREENIQLALVGENEKIKKSILAEGTIGVLRENMLAHIEKINVYAKNKSEELYAESLELKNKLRKQLLLLIATIMIFSMIIIDIMIKNIRKPLKEMNDAVLRFHHGDMDARSSYEAKNEFGVLSSSINTLAELVQNNTDLNKKTVNLEEIMLSEDDAGKFFQAILSALAFHTGAQMSAVYLLSDDQRTFELFLSIGLESNAKQTFKVDNYEGEFGAALLTRKQQHIKNIPEDTRFKFHTVNGMFIPREIITIPILSGNQVIAIISLATINRFEPQSTALIDNTVVTMSARIEGILAYRRIKEYRKALEQQNKELADHKSELSAQTAELVQQNTELEIQKNQLNEASRLKTNFLSNMSHELRTPLNSVIALSGVLNRRLINQIPEEEYSYLEIIERNGKNLLTLINDILDISRIEAGREEMEITKFNTINLVSEVITMISPQVKQKNIELFQEAGDSELYISSDADKCRHILQNLIGNAIKFTEKGKVVVSTQRDENNIEIKVADTGIGVSAENLGHIFDEFRQADGSTSRRFGGTGLGLAIAKKYANLLGGTILVKSTLGEGSEFTLSLPFHYVAENRIVEEERIAEEERTFETKYVVNQPLIKGAYAASDKTVLLVEDNEAAIIQIKDLVEGIGIRVLAAQDAGEALEIIGQVIPDAIILDLMMPEIDGFRLLEIIRNAEPTAHIPVLVLTAKHITKNELKFLKRNNIHQLIQKGDVNRIELQNAVIAMLSKEYIKEKQNQQPLSLESKPLILVVEDNPDNMITVKAILAEEFTVVGAVDGQEGIEMARSYIPNLVLMDIALPGINGIEAYHEIKKIPQLQYIPIIALTASAMDCDRETILAHGFDAFIAKPIIAKQLLNMISEVLYGK